MKRTILMLGLLSLLLPAPVVAQNLVQNPGFDSDLSSWLNRWGYLAVLDSRDANGSASSGSALLTNTLGNGGSLGILEQCLPVNPGDEVNASAKVYQPSGQAGDGQASFRFSFYSDTSCVTEISAFHYSSGSSDLDTWFNVTRTATAPASTAAIRLYLAVSGYILGEPFSAHFDDVAVTAGAAPIFTDGFENNDTSAWTAAVP